MYCIVDFSIIPIGVEPSLSKYIAETLKILDKAGLTYKLHAKGTNIEGELGEVMAIIEKCISRLHEIGVPRVDTMIHVGVIILLF
ncbi:616_t:CDS:2 [Ambispora leptoticha]|uniref:616_t:CDS:1 n=1 Tax=Ambispora leptoticha TaxID=144679 RepID=A0A9N9DLF9_9GLOM|nr:616_t:CDS:2 [Ambispora leptoticha]